MTIAVCLKCGADKADALTTCPKCGFNPETSTAEDQVMSILLSDPNFETGLPEPEVPASKTDVAEIPDFDPALIENLTTKIEHGTDREATDGLQRYAFPAVITAVVTIAGIAWLIMR